MKEKNFKLIVFLTALGSVIAVAVLLVLFLVIIPENRKKRELEELVKEYYENKLVIYEEENEKYDDYEVDVAFIGDSLTDGYDLQKYYPQYVTSNRGIAGETTIGLEKRLKLSVYDLKPKVVVMLIGANNIYSMFENYENILIGLKENLPNTKVVLISLTSMGDEWGVKNEIASFNNVKIKMLAEKYGFEYVDMFTALFDIEENEIKAEYTTDGGHLTEKGYEVFTNTLTPYLVKLLGK